LNSENLNNLSKQISSPVPFWFLNGHVDEWHIVREFEMMADKGIGDVILHPRYGLQCEYLSDEWFTIFGWCVREAKKHGMCVWMYDELNWPSGTAGNSVMKINPDYRGKYLAVEPTRLGEIDFDSFEPGKYMIAANIEGGVVTKTRVLEDVAAARGLTGDWRLFNCKLKYDEFYIDTLSFDAVNCFKHVTYDEYFNRFGDEFGKSIRAAFTDEPSIYWVSVGYDDWNLPYTEDYFSTFEAKYGYSPVPMIPHLFYPSAKGTAFRADYWEHAGYLFNERYHGNLGGWCREHGIIYTGHNNHEEPLRYQIRFQGDAFGLMRAMDIPGVDHLGKATLGNNWISIIGHKICSSEAHFDGKARCMSESFGVMDWDTTFENLKRVTDWQFALGINLLIPHAVYHTISGMTKRESPPSFFYQSPHWTDFEYFVEYVRQLESMLCGGRHLCKVAVMYPSSGLWASYQTDRKTSDFEHTDNFLNSLCLELVKNQIDFDLVDYQALKDAELDDGKLKLADEAYEFLIVPATAYMRASEIARLTQIVGAGVKTTLFHKSMEPLRDNLPDGMRGASFVRSEELQSFVDNLKKQLDDDIQISGGGAEDIMAYRREKDGHKVTFLLNRSDKHRKISALIKDYPNAAIFDQETGEFTKLDGRQAGQKSLSQLRFQPNQSFFIVSGVPDAREPESVSEEPTPIEVKNLSVSVPFNVASIYHFTYTKPGGDEHPEPVEGREVDVRTNPRYMPCQWTADKPDFTQFAGDYEATITLDFDPAADIAVQMILDKDFAECEVYVNGQKVDLKPAPDFAPEFFLTDYQDVSAFVGHLLKRGENVLKVISPTKLSEPLRLVGDFRVHLAGESITLTAPAHIDPFELEMDYPFYSGTVTYRAEFDWGLIGGDNTKIGGDMLSPPPSLILNLHEPHDSVTLRVNGKDAGKRLWQPYTFDIAALAQSGKNTLEIEVRNNMANLILGNPRPLGLRQMPTLAGS
jgi:hypothetical protein